MLGKNRFYICIWRAGLYIVDAVIKSSRATFGRERDPYAQRFATNVRELVRQVFSAVSDSDKELVRSIKLFLVYLFVFFCLATLFVSFVTFFCVL